MSFLKYRSIESKVELPPFDCEFVCTEKLHGANFQLYYDEPSKELRAGRRKDYLKPGDKFYNWKDILTQYGSAVSILSKLLQIEGTSFIIYGELYGSNIQKEIKYCNTPRFIVFDVYLSELGIFLNYDMMYELATKAGFHVVKPLERGKFIDLVKFNVQNRPTTIPEDLEKENPGLDLTDIKNLPKNFMEGIVLRPVIEPPKRHDFDPDVHRHNRYMSKIKSKSFMEKEGTKTPSKRVEDSIEMTEKLAVFQEYINANRFHAVRSKEEEIQSMKEIPKYIKLMYEDILEDLRKDLSEPTFELNKKIVGRVNGMIAILVKTEINSLLTSLP
jgi:Rnl2 family RNA ligase